ncbi:MAG: hypothetical protein RIQ71_2577, partial [Verrucomicrobiota bacterium]
MTRDASAAIYTWSGTTNTNVLNNTLFTPNTTNGWQVSAANGAVFTNTWTNGAVVFNWGGSNVQLSNTLITGFSNDVIMTNLGNWRLDSVTTVTNTNALVGRAAGTVYIYNVGTSMLGGSATLLQGNMALYLNSFSGHTTAARALTNNVGSLAVSNLNVNNATTTTVGSVSNGVTTLTFQGTGTTTVTGSITVNARSNGATQNAGALIVSSGVLNIATTNDANIAAVTGWNSGLVITNTGSLFVRGQKSLGEQAYNIKIGTTTGNTTRFGVFDSSEWATNLDSTCTLTNNFSILNASGALATNVFQAGSATTNKTLTLSGIISSTNADGTLLFLYGTNVLAGANTFSNALVVSNSTLMLSNATALGVTTAGTMVAGTAGVLDLNGQTVGAEALTLSNSSAPSLRNSSATAASFAGAVTLGADTIISNTGGITLSGGISGSYALTKAGASSLTLSAASSYTGATTINGGTLNASHASALGTNGLTVASGATLGIAAAVSKNNITNNGTISIGAGASLTANALAGGNGALNLTGTGGSQAAFTNTASAGTSGSSTVLNIGSLSLGGNSTIAFANAYNNITASGAVSISGTGNFLSIAGVWDAGSTYNLLTGSSLSASGITLTNAGWSLGIGSTYTNGRTTYLFNTNATSLFMAVGGQVGNITWNGGTSGNWTYDTSTTPWTNNADGSASAFYQGDNVT